MGDSEFPLSQAINVKSHHHDRHHHVQEGLGLIPVP
jgi:hypothetical protein